jgi:RNA polymerase sigma factor (TIGR02999 family)
MGGSVDQGREVTDTGMASSKNVEDGAASGAEPAVAAGPQEPGDGSPAPEPTADDVASPGVSPAGMEHAVTRALASAAAGDRESQDRLWQLTYAELHQIAQRHLLGERPDHTLSATALVHEAYMRLVGQRDIDWQDRAHFFGVASKVCRRILVDHARRRLAQKRGGARGRVTLDSNMIAVNSQSDELLALNEALDRLAQLNERLAQIVECRYFGGLSEEQTAEVLGISVRTVRRDWVKAKGWLYTQLQPDAPSASDSIR